MLYDTGDFGYMNKSGAEAASTVGNDCNYDGKHSLQEEAKRKINEAGLRLISALSEEDDDQLSAARRFIDTFKSEYAEYLYSISRSRYVRITGDIMPFEQCDIANAFYVYATEALFNGGLTVESAKPATIMRICQSFSAEKVRGDSDYPFFEYLKGYIWKHSISRWNQERNSDRRQGIKQTRTQRETLVRFNEYLQKKGISENSCKLEEAAKEMGIPYKTLKDALQFSRYTLPESIEEMIERENEDGEKTGREYGVWDKYDDDDFAKNLRAVLMMIEEKVFRSLSNERQMVYSYALTSMIIKNIVENARAEFCVELDDAIHPDGYSYDNAGKHRKRYSELRGICNADNAMLKTDEGWNFLDIERRLADNGYMQYTFFSSDVLLWFKSERQIVTNKWIAETLGVSQSQVTKIYSKTAEIIKKACSCMVS